MDDETFPKTAPPNINNNRRVIVTNLPFVKTYSVIVRIFTLRRSLFYAASPLPSRLRIRGFAPARVRPHPNSMVGKMIKPKRPRPIKQPKRSAFFRAAVSTEKRKPAITLAPVKRSSQDSNPGA